MPDDSQICVRDLRNVKRDKVRRSIVLAVREDGEWIEVVSARGRPGNGPHVLVRRERREAGILGLSKDTHFRLDSIEWVHREHVLGRAGKRCPPGLMERIRQMQQDAAMGVADRLVY